MPAGVRHRIAFSGEVAMRTLYVSKQRASAIPHGVRTLEVSPLLAHLIGHIRLIRMLDPRVPEHEHLAAVLIDLIKAAPGLDLVLPQPEDARAARLALYIREHASDTRDLKALASAFGASLRTMQRHFSAETGLSLDAWRQKARLVHAVAILVRGDGIQRRKRLRIRKPERLYRCIQEALRCHTGEVRARYEVTKRHRTRYTASTAD